MANRQITVNAILTIVINLRFMKMPTKTTRGPAEPGKAGAAGGVKR
jgi:hypothetical protein